MSFESSGASRSTALARTRGVIAASLALALLVPARAVGPRFYPDDPITVDRDTAFDARDVKKIELSKTYDFFENTFSERGTRRPAGRALNVNTLDEVPDSTWFTNRIGRRPMAVEEIFRGPDRFTRLEIYEWLIVEGKGPDTFQPGFRATDARHPGPVYKLEVDPPDNPEMATGAEVIGTAFYHAFGYNTVETYLVNVDPAKISIAPDATIQDASGKRRFVRADLDAILRLGARNADGRYRMSAQPRLPERIGRFKYYGTRPDDPNDIYSHEHRRELRANRVFAAWLDHDDSRAENTLDLLVNAGDRKYITHYMYDFDSILGSATRSRHSLRSGHEYFLERKSSLVSLFSLGFYVPWWLRIEYPSHIPAAVGRVEGDAFEPEQWKPEYPNAAFSNMRSDDAFWGARIVSKCSDAAIAAIVDKAAFTDPAAARYLTSVLVKRRDTIATAWLNAVNPLVNFSLTSDGILTFENAAVSAAAATPASTYTLSWSRFDNDADRHETVGPEMTASNLRARAPDSLRTGSEFVAVTVRGQHPQHEAWSKPIRAYFRRTTQGWTTVGLERLD